MASTDQPPINKELAEHLRRVRKVNREFQIPMIDFWDPDIAEALEELTEKNGRISGVIGDYRLQYFEGRDLAVELNIFDRASRRRIAQDGSDSTQVLELLRQRMTPEKPQSGSVDPGTGP
jgi:hypothetical protein